MIRGTENWVLPDIFRVHALLHTCYNLNMATATATIHDPDIEVGEQSRLLSGEEQPLGEVKGSIAEKAVAGLSAVSFGASVLAMLVESNPIVYISGTIGAAISPYAAIQQQKITQVDALAETNERGAIFLVLFFVTAAQSLELLNLFP